MPRAVRLVLCAATGEVLGELPELTVEPQWWPEVAPIVATVRERFGVEVSVLRLLEATAPSDEMGGPVRYLAEVLDGEPGWQAYVRPTGSADADLTVDHPLRQQWARVGGVADTIAWADSALAAAGRPRTGPAEHVKSWNLSSVLRLPTAAGTVWCKSVPPFFAHEGAVIAMVAEHDPGLVPVLVAADRSRGTVLLGDVPGDDQWEAPVDRLVEMVQRLVRLQSAFGGRTGELLATGCWDWRQTVFPSVIGRLVSRDDVRVTLTAAELAAVDALVADLPRRLEDLAACGLPESLVHGDFHPGNWRFGAAGLVLLDWPDSGVGHPMLDVAAFLPRLAADDQPVVATAWVAAWRDALPESDPGRAAELIPPVAALRQAALYRAFLDRIEPSERCYHAADPARWLRRAITAAASASV